MWLTLPHITKKQVIYIIHSNGPFVEGGDLHRPVKSDKRVRFPYGPHFSSMILVRCEIRKPVIATEFR